MHIAIVQPWMDYLGGAQILAFEMANEFKNQGHKVSMITTYFDKTKFKNPNFNIYEVGNNKLLNNTIGKFFPKMESSLFFVLKRIKKQIKKINPDKIWVTNFPSNWITGKNTYWYCLEAPFAIYPDIVNPIAGKINPSTGFKFLFSRQIIKYLDKKIIKKHNNIISMCKQSNYLLNKIYNISASQTINPGVNIKNYDKITKKIILPKKINFLLVSRIHFVKNVMLALKAYNLIKNKNTSLTIVGTGPELENLKKFSKHYELNVDFKGYVSEEEKIALYKASDIVLFPSLYESFGLVPVEAMLCKKPVIAINEWGPTETIINNKTGLLVNNDVKEFANAMEYLMNNPLLRKKMGLAGRKRAEKEFSIEVMVNKLIKFMEVN